MIDNVDRMPRICYYRNYRITLVENGCQFFVVNRKKNFRVGKSDEKVKTSMQVSSKIIMFKNESTDDFFFILMQEQIADYWVLDKKKKKVDEKKMNCVFLTYNVAYYFLYYVRSIG